MRLRCAYHHNPRIQPLVDGAVKLEGYECEWEVGDAADLHLRHLNENAFDVFEFSLSNLFITKSRPERAHLRWLGIPTFLLKAGFFLKLHVRKDAGIRSYADLRGKTVGVPDFQMTAALWMRIVLRELYGIRPQDISWVNGRPPSQTHGEGTTDALAPDIPLRRLEEGESLDELLQRGEIQAALGDSRGCPVHTSDAVQMLPREVGRDLWVDFRAKTGLLPVNHVLVMQERLLDQDPDLPMKLYDAFEASKQVAYARARQAAAGLLVFQELAFAENARDFGEDPYTPGLAANRRMLEMVVDELVDEQLIPAHVDDQSVFAPATRGT
jgi:4,5-dihydroxyphthalate decarboxylase